MSGDSCHPGKHPAISLETPGAAHEVGERERCAPPLRARARRAKRQKSESAELLSSHAYEAIQVVKSKCEVVVGSQAVVRERNTQTLPCAPASQPRRAAESLIDSHALRLALDLRLDLNAR